MIRFALMCVMYLICLGCKQTQPAWKYLYYKARSSVEPSSELDVMLAESTDLIVESLDGDSYDVLPLVVIITKHDEDVYSLRMSYYSNNVIPVATSLKSDHESIMIEMGSKINKSELSSIGHRVFDVSFAAGGSFNDFVFNSKFFDEFALNQIIEIQMYDQNFDTIYLGKINAKYIETD